MRRWAPPTAIVAALATWLLGSGTAAAQACLIELDGSPASVAFHDLAPGETREWAATVRNVVDEPVEVVLDLGGTGGLAPALEVAVDACDEPWDGPVAGPATCPGTRAPVSAPVRADAGASVDLGELVPGAAWHGLVRATFDPAAGNEHQGATGTVRAVFTAASDSITCSVPTPEDPPPTNPDGPDRAPEAPGGPAGPSAPRDGGSGPPRRGEPDPGPRRDGPMPRTGGEVATLLALGMGVTGLGLVLRRRAADRRR